MPDPVKPRRGLAPSRRKAIQDSTQNSHKRLKNLFMTPGLSAEPGIQTKHLISLAQAHQNRGA